MSGGPGDTDEDEATTAFLAGGPDALRAAYEAHGALVHTFCRRALGASRAPDATQEVFTQVWQARDRFDPAKGTLRGWVMGIARFKVLGALRHDGSRPVLVAETTGSDARPDRDIDLLADRLTLAQALGGLPDRTRKVIHLAYVDGLSHREIADQMDLPLGSVKSDLRRGLVRLRADLEAQEPIS
jgi:RNA polymerase sigma factor (sigma-70 family)